MGYREVLGKPVLPDITAREAFSMERVHCRVGRAVRGEYTIEWSVPRASRLRRLGKVPPDVNTSLTPTRLAPRTYSRPAIMCRPTVVPGGLNRLNADLRWTLHARHAPPLQRA